MSAPADLPFDLNALPPAVREAFAAMQAKVAGLEAQTERQDYLIAELRHALYGKRSEQLGPMSASWPLRIWKRPSRKPRLPGMRLLNAMPMAKPDARQPSATLAICPTTCRASSR